MRKFLRFLMLVLMATWGAESYAECVLIQSKDVSDNKSSQDFGDITISISPGVEDDTHWVWHGIHSKLEHYDKTVNNWDVSYYNGAYTSKALKIPVASDFTVSCSGGYIDYILISFNNGLGDANHSEHWKNIKVAGDNTNTYDSNYHRHENDHLTNKAWWGGYGSGSSSVTFYDDRTTADEGSAYTQGLLWIYVFYHKTATIAPTAAFAGSGRDFCKSDTTVALNLSSSMDAEHVNNYSSSAMRYTIDGNAPTTSSSTYGSGITINQTRTIKVINQAWLKLKTQGGKANDEDFSGLPDTYSAVSDVVTVGTITQYWPVSTESGSHKENNKTKYYATFCHEHYMKVPSGCTAYTYQLTTKNKVKYLTASKLYDVGAVIPPNTPVIVQSDSPIKKASAVKFENPLNNTAGNDPDANRTRYFKGNGTGSAKTVSGDIYFLMRYKTNELRFMRYSSNVCPAHACYLDLSSSSAKSFVFQFPGEDGETTGISGVTADRSALDPSAPMYNAAGQRVGASYKGIVIQNGRKFVKR